MSKDTQANNLVDKNKQHTQMNETLITSGLVVIATIAVCAIAAIVYIDSKYRDAILPRAKRNGSKKGSKYFKWNNTSVTLIEAHITRRLAAAEGRAMALTALNRHSDKQKELILKIAHSNPAKFEVVNDRKGYVIKLK